MAQSNKPRQPIFLTRRRGALITCVITGRWHAAVNVSSHWGTGQDRRQAESHKTLEETHPLHICTVTPHHSSQVTFCSFLTLLHPLAPQFSLPGCTSPARSQVGGHEHMALSHPASHCAACLGLWGWEG